MPLTVTKSENRVKPVTLYDRAQVLWITLADRAANWTPWSRKADSEDEELTKLLEALSRFRRAQLKLLKLKKEEAAGDIEQQESEEETEKFDPDAHPRAPAGTTEGGQFAPKKGSLNFAKRAEEALKQAKSDVENQFNTFADSFAQKLGMTHDKKGDYGDNGWDDDDLTYADTYSRSYANDKTLNGAAAESVQLRLHSNETIDLAYNISAHNSYADQSVERSYRPSKLDKAQEAIEKTKTKFLAEHKEALIDAINGGKSSFNDEQEWQRARSELRTVQQELRNRNNATKSDNSGGGDKMAAEYIQAILCPVDLDPKRLKQIIGEHQSELLLTATAEKHDNVTKYTLMPEDQFESLNVSPLADGVKVMHGALKAEQAEKLDLSTAVVYEKSGRSLNSLVWDKTNSLQNGIQGVLDLEQDKAVRDQKIMDLIDGFATWLFDAIAKAEMAEAQANAGAIKSETKKRPSAWERFKGALTGATENSIAEKADNKGGEEMDEEKIKTIAEETAKATVAEMVATAEKAEAETAAEKADKEAAEKAEARIKGLEDQVAALLKEKEEAAKKAETIGEDKAKELEGLKARMAALEAEKADLAKKMELFESAGGSPSKGEDNARKSEEPYKGQSFDTIYQK